MSKCKQCEIISNCHYGIQDCESIISTCDEFSFDLIEHDSNLLDKVAEKLKARVMICANCEIIGCDTEYFKPMCEKAEEGIFAREFNEYVDEVINELKAEVEE